MKIVYYYSIHAQSSPVKTFLRKYAVSFAKTAQQERKRARAAALIDQTIKYVAERAGKPVPPHAQPLRGYPFHEMRIKDSSNLIRIMYFCYHEGTLVLLHAFEKPDYYEKAKKKKVEKEIRRALEQSYANYKDFLTYKHYETY